MTHFRYFQNYWSRSTLIAYPIHYISLLQLQKVAKLARKTPGSPICLLDKKYSVNWVTTNTYVFHISQIWCIPLPKRPKDIFKPCSPRKEIANVQARIAIQHLVHECGFEDVVKKSWIEPVNALVPGTGYVVDWEGVFSEKAPGVSLESFLSRNRMQQVLEMMKKVNSSQVCSPHCLIIATNFLLSEQFLYFGLGLHRFKFDTPGGSECSFWSPYFTMWPPCTKRFYWWKWKGNTHWQRSIAWEKLAGMWCWFALSSDNRGEITRWEKSTVVLHTWSTARGLCGAHMEYPDFLQNILFSFANFVSWTLLSSKRSSSNQTAVAT